MRLSSRPPYCNRQEKAHFAYGKYRNILKGKILDVGADCGYLRNHISTEHSYETVGLESDHTYHLDLEQGLPLPENKFDCVLCFDVLEHIEHIHQLFDDLCRVSNRYCLISLPNAWSNFLGILRSGYYQVNRPMKFYNLPPDPPEDRHRWFFNMIEAKEFIRQRGNRNGMQVVDTEITGIAGLKNSFYYYLLKLFIHRSIPIDAVKGDVLWCLLEKKPQNNRFLNKRK